MTTKTREAPPAVSLMLVEPARSRLRALRQEAGTTQVEVASAMTKAGFSWGQGTTADVERGARRLTLEEAFALAVLWCVPVISLIGGELELPAGSLDADRVTRLFVGGPDGKLHAEDWVHAMVALGLEAGDAGALGLRLAEARKAREEDIEMLATAIATQFRTMLRHLPDDELPESEGDGEEALAFKTFGGGNLMIRRQQDGALYTLAPEVEGVIRYTVEGGSAWGTVFVDGEQASRFETAPPAEISALN